MGRSQDDPAATLQGHGPVMESLHDGLGNYLEASKEAKEVTGRRPEALLGDSSVDMVHEDDLDVVADAYEAAWNTGRAVVLVMRCTDREGASYWTRTRFVLQSRKPPRFKALTRRSDRPEKGQAWFLLEPEE